MTEGPSSQREAAKAGRRDAILDAALVLIDQSDVNAEHASVEAIARQAGVAPATVYNLFGTRDAILVGLLRRFVTELAHDGSTTRTRTRHPLDSLLALIDLLCRALAERPRAWAHIIVKLGDMSANPATGVSSGHDISALIATRWEHLQTSGVIQSAFPPAALGLQTYTMLNGALMRWAVGRINHDALRLLLRHGVLLIATATASQTHAISLARDLRSAGKQLTAIIKDGTQNSNNA